MNGKPLLAIPHGRRTKRNQAAEGLRIFSAFGIVWFHAGLFGHVIAYSGLVVFLAFLGCFAEYPRRDPAVAISERALRLAPPWILWFSIYALINLWRNRPIISSNENIAAAILAGPEIHLWFIPFALICYLILTLTKLYLDRVVLRQACLITVIGLLATATHWSRWQAPSPIPQYISAIVPLLSGVLFGLRVADVELERHNKWPVDEFTIVVIITLILSIAANDDIDTPYFMGLFAFAIALTHGDRLIPPSVDIRWISDCMFGVYLIHPIFLHLMKITQHTVNAFGVVCAFVLSTICVILVARFCPFNVSRYIFGVALNKRQKTQNTDRKG